MRKLRRWIEKEPVDLDEAEALAKALQIHRLTAQLLMRRGIQSAEEGQAFLTPSLRDLPDPDLMKGMKEACARIVHAIVEGERIVVYGDYDVDGVTSTSLLMLFLRELGLQDERLHFFIPNRVEHGYGLQEVCIPEVMAMGCDLLLTVDCGMTSAVEIELFKEQGVEAIIIDHHLPKEGEPRPDAYAILNPHQEGCPYPDKRLAAVGLTYQLLIGLRRALRDHGFFKYHPEPNLLKYIDLVALGTVADIVPLLGVNRILVYHGLQQMRKTEWTGLKALLKISRSNPDKLSAGTLGFQLGPRINAAGRLQDASVGVKLFCSQDWKEAEALAKEMDRENQARKELQERMFEQARAQLLQQPEMREDFAIVLAHEEWHPGVVGIVASKLVEEYHRPTVLIAIDPATGVGKGSCRSIPDFHLLKGLTACSQHLVKFGGHAAAAGVTVEADQVEALRKSLIVHAREKLDPNDLFPRLSYDAEISPGQISEDLVDDLEKLEPHGMGNPRPTLVAHDVILLEQKKTRDSRHLQLTIEAPPYRSLKGIAFGKGKLYPLPKKVSIAFTAEFDEWQGRRKIQLKVKAFQSG